MSLRLIADIGGTNARFALAGADGRIGPVARLPAAAHPTFIGALDTWLAGEPQAKAISSAAIAAAGPVSANGIKVTNLPWRIDGAEVSARLRGMPVRLLNDLEAVAMALPVLGPEETAPIRPGPAAEPDAPRIAVNVGTGFGAATAVPGPGGWIALAGEPGHMTFGATTEDEFAQAPAIRSVEHLLSGPGLTALHGRLGGAPMSPEAIFAAAPSDPIAQRSVDLFARALGRIAGDLVLACGAWGGCYLCGSLAAHAHGAGFEALLLSVFDAKGAMAERLAKVPVVRITEAEPALRGLAAMSL